MNRIYFNTGLCYQPFKIIGIGLNYHKHIDEMKSKRTDEPVIFIKANNSLHDLEEAIPIPKDSGAVHHEIELAVCIGKRGSQIDADKADDYIKGYAVALDLTLRDKQLELKKLGRPWALAKGFDAACPISVFVNKEDLADPTNLDLILEINGKVRQHGNTSEMLFSIPEIIAFISKYFTLEEGDIILTGTPSGVGPLHSGDKLRATISNLASVETTII